MRRIKTDTLESEILEARLRAEAAMDLSRKRRRRARRILVLRCWRALLRALRAHL